MKKATISANQNIFYDGKQVDHNDLTLEQQYNDTKVSSTIANIVGSGVINDQLEERILYSYSATDIVTNGPQTSDIEEGSQLRVSLTNSKAFGLRKVKLLLVGLNFESKLIYDTFELVNNETLITKQHYTSLLFVYTNDLEEVADLSLNLGGNLVVSEARSILLSKDTEVDANTNPSLFFRDLYIKSSLVADGSTLDQLLEAALPDYDIADLNINVDFTQSRQLLRNDIVTRLAQKITAKSANIQKVTVLMSAENIDEPGNLEWDGDLVVSIYPLQSSVSCITDIIPENKIDYDPTSSPLAQTSINYNTLLDRGYELNGVPQPVDFIFSNTITANNSSIKVGEAYAIVFKRSGSSTVVNLLFTTSENTDESRQLSIFNGSGWTNVNSESLWYKVHADSAKVSSGQYYTYGNGVTVDKVKFDSLTGLNIDYSLSQLDFYNNQVYKAICQSVLEKTALEENPRTGDNVYGQKRLSPKISLLSPSAYLSLQNTLADGKNEILTIGAVKDTNKKYLSSAGFEFTLHNYSVVGNKLFIKVITDTMDPDFDQAVIDLKSMIITNAIKSAKVTTVSSDNARIADAKIHTVHVGNWKNSTIDYSDLTEFKIFKGLDLSTLPADTYTISVVGPAVVYTPSYYFLTYPWTGTEVSVDMILADSNDQVIDNTFVGNVTNNNAYGDELLITDASGDIEATLAENTDPYIYLYGSNADEYLGGKYLVLSASGDSAVIKKVVLERDYLKALSFDINQDLAIDSDDLDLLKQFIDKEPYVSGVDPYAVINTNYEVLELSLERYVDRHDDYVADINTRLDDLHLFLDLWEVTNFKTIPTVLTTTDQLNWLPYDVICSSDPRQVLTEYTDSKLSNLDDDVNVFPSPLDFEKNINNHYVPGNLILEDNILNKDQSFHTLDFESFDIILEIPEGLDGYEKHIDIFNTFVAENDLGLTYIGFEAKKFSDGTYAQPDAMDNNQVRMSAAIQSFTPELNSDYLGYDAIIVDGRMGLDLADNGVLSLNFTNLYNDPGYVTGNTKVKVTVFLKKAGFANTNVHVSGLQLFNLLS